MPKWPAWVWVWASATVLFFLLRAADAIHSVPLCVYLSALAGAFSFGLDQLRAVGPAHLLLRLRQIVLVLVIVAVPSLFDPSTIEADNLPRLVVLVVTAVLLLGIWAVDAVWSGWRPRRLVNGLQWVLLGIVVWFGVTTLTSVEPRRSLLGAYGSYEGFILLAALAVLAFALAESFTAEALPALFKVVVAATVPVLVYCVIQLYGFVLHKGSTWDFVRWHGEVLHNVFASLGNPNHLAGYLVTVLPIGLVTAVLTKHRVRRTMLWAWVALMFLVVLQTAARGAWLGGLAGGAVLLVGLLPRLRTNARTVGIVAGAAVVIAVALIAGGSRFLGAKASALFQFGSGSSVSQRYGYWSAALHLALHHPLVGTGPDTYLVTYARYQSAALAKELGSVAVNGAHNIFLSWLANEGVPGFILIVALFVLGVAWGVRTWRSLRVDGTEPAHSDVRDTIPGPPHRYLVVALVAALVAYFVQASFDVEQVATLFTLFMVLGFLGIANRGVWPLADLVHLPFRSVSARSEPEVRTAEQDPEYPSIPAPVGVHGRSTVQARAELRRLAGAIGAGAVALSAFGLAFWRSDAMWRADHQAWLRTSSPLLRATELNPWEPSYFQDLGEDSIDGYSSSPSSPGAPALAQAAVQYFGQEVALDGDNTVAQAQYGGALEAEAEEDNYNEALLRRALAAFDRARQDDPYYSGVSAAIDGVEKLLDNR
jgi:O-antigen ligase